MSELDDDQLATIWRERIERDLFDGAARSDAPVTIFLGAQPGAGKTLAGDRATQDAAGDVRPIVGDDLRAYHPDYSRLSREQPLAMPDETAQASGRWIAMAVEHANEQGYSTLIEGTWRNPSVPLEGAQLARDHGRHTHAVVVAVPPAVSRLSTLERYYRDADAGDVARWTPPAAHDDAARTLPDVVEQVAASELIDRFTVTDRSGAVLFDQAGGAGPTRGQAAAAVFRSAFDRALTQQEREDAIRVVPVLVDAHQRHTAASSSAQEVITWAQKFRDGLRAGPSPAPERRRRRRIPGQGSSDAIRRSPGPDHGAGPSRGRGR